MRVVIAEDATLLREGLAELLVSVGHDVVARVGDAETLLERVAEHHPDLAIVDVRLPPDYDLEGMVAAQRIRSTFPQTAVLVLSQHIEARMAGDLMASGGGFGYLLKDRILRVSDFLDAATRVAEGGSALDPEVVASLLTRHRDEATIQALTPRELQVLSLMAQGLTNSAIANRLFVSENTVESHVGSILRKLGLSGVDDGTENRRVRAVMAYLRSAPT